MSEPTAREAPYSPDVVETLIQRAYEAAADPPRWRDFLEVLQAAIDAGPVAITFIDTQHAHAFVQAIVGFDEAALRLYQERYAATDPYILFAKENDLYRSGVIALVQDYLADDAFAGTDFWESFAKPNGYIGGMWANLIAEGPMLAILALNRKPGKHFGRRDVALIEMLRPHLQTAIRIARGVTLDAQLGRAAIATMSRMRRAAFVCDADGRVVYQNAAAQASDLLEVRDGRLSVRYGSGLHLQQALATVTDPVAEPADMVAALTDRFGERVLVVVSPVPRDEVLPFEQPLAAVMIPGCGRKQPEVPLGIDDLYGFTPREAALAERLLAGRTVAMAAHELDMTPATARTHLKKMFRKAGVRRQPELIRVLLTSGR